jgi:cystathionine beta-lyase/cystathionine gamma-synthase
MGAICASFLFELSDDYNRFYRHNFNFKLTQSLRLVFSLISFSIWGLLLYVWVKDIFA